MDDTEDDARYPPNPSSSPYPPPNFHHSHRPKLPVRNASSGPPPLAPNFLNEDDDYEDDENEDDGEEGGGGGGGDDDDDDDDDDGNAVKRFSPDDEVDDDEDEEKEDEDEDEEEEEEEEGNEQEEGEGYPKADTEEDESVSCGRKRRRMEKSAALGFELVPRARARAPQEATGTPISKPPAPFGRNSPADWSEEATFALLDAWGDRFLQHGRKSLRSDEWAEVAKRVSQVSKTVHTDSQCRNRLDTLKKKYKKEKMRLGGGSTSKCRWVYFKKMEMLMMSPPPRQPGLGLACGVDSGEYVFMNPRVYVNHSNGSDELRDSPGNSEEFDEGDDDDDDDESDGLPPTTRKRVENGGASSSSYKLLAESIHKFGEIYQKIEVSKRQQMIELEKMRVDFHRDLELQKRQILERAQAEIAKIRQGDDEEIDVSVENTSG